jgi:hypothetical protein
VSWEEEDVAAAAATTAFDDGDDNAHHDNALAVPGAVVCVLGQHCLKFV